MSDLSTTYQYLKTNPELFWKNIKATDRFMFNNDEKLTKITICSPVKRLSESTFLYCNNLTEVVLPKTLKHIDKTCFSNCISLKKIEFPDGLKSIGDASFYNCKNLTSIVMPNSVKHLGGEVFNECQNLTNVTLSNKIKVLPSKTFAFCNKLESISIPKSVRYISPFCFEGCYSLKNLDYSTKTSVHEYAVQDCDFKYAYTDPVAKRVHFAENLPENTQNFVKVYDLKLCKSAFYDFNKHYIDFYTSNKSDKIYEAGFKLNKLGIKLPYIIVRDMVEADMFDEFVSSSHFKFFKNEVKELLDYAEKNWVEIELVEFFSFAIAFGCFKKEPMLDKNKKPTNTFMYQKASTLLAQMYKMNAFNNFTYNHAVRNCEFDEYTSQSFINFLSYKDQNQKYSNLELLLDIGQECPNVFSRVMKNFDNVSELRTYVNEEGISRTMPWRSAIEKYLKNTRYYNVTKENEDIAEEFNSKNMSQDNFNSACILRQIAKDTNVPHHILGKELKEETIIEQIEKVKADTSLTVEEAQKLIDELYKKEFSFEMLDKYDPRNFLLGIYCKCCATINSIHYGSKITRASVKEHDVQNMVANDPTGRIIGKGTIYLNREHGYAVINDFEINDKYRDGEIFKDGVIHAGYYRDDYPTPPEQPSTQSKQRKKIFNTFLNCIKEFVKEYDSQNPKKPLKFVTVGADHNRLNSLCSEYNVLTEEDVFKVPASYGFNDAEKKQYILYSRYPLTKTLKNKTTDKSTGQDENKDPKKVITKEDLTNV